MVDQPLRPKDEGALYTPYATVTASTTRLPIAGAQHLCSYGARTVGGRVSSVIPRERRSGNGRPQAPCIAVLGRPRRLLKITAVATIHQEATAWHFAGQGVRLGGLWCPEC